MALCFMCLELCVCVCASEGGVSLSTQYGLTAVDTNLNLLGGYQGAGQWIHCSSSGRGRIEMSGLCPGSREDRRMWTPAGLQLGSGLLKTAGIPHAHEGHQTVQHTLRDIFHSAFPLAEGGCPERIPLGTQLCQQQDELTRGKCFLRISVRPSSYCCSVELREALVILWSSPRAILTSGQSSSC